MVNFISRAFSGPRKPRNPDDKIEADSLRSIVSARSHGNVRLQNGRYYTAKDVDAKFREVQKLDFAE